MTNLIATNALVSKKNFIGYFCNVEEAQQHAQAAVDAALSEHEPLIWKEIPEDSVLFKAFMAGTLLPARVLRAYYADSCLVILDYDY
jgi:hypothetical protein